MIRLQSTSFIRRDFFVAPRFVYSQQITFTTLNIIYIQLSRTKTGNCWQIVWIRGFKSRA